MRQPIVFPNKHKTYQRCAALFVEHALERDRKSIRACVVRFINAPKSSHFQKIEAGGEGRFKGLSLHSERSIDRMFDEYRTIFELGTFEAY